MGPVLVFGASNFPLAFSVAGGDTAAALAAGNTVVVKAQQAHPGTSEIVARIIRDCVVERGLPAGVFSLLLDTGTEIAKALMHHPALKAITFTGSHRAGRILMDLAAQRPVPVPCMAEMSSSNTVFIFPGAFERGADQAASRLFQSYTLGAVQFCTKPGMVFLPALAPSSAFITALEKLATECGPFTMLTPQIAAAYHGGLLERVDNAKVKSSRGADKKALSETQTALLQTDIDALREHPFLSDEIFGPSTLIVHYDEREAMLDVARRLEGHLTAIRSASYVLVFLVASSSWHRSSHGLRQKTSTR
jgi:alpha-ketoglutaric semialdehyde dehydrogenase